MMTAEDLAERFRDAMRRTASAVSVLATDGPGGRAGVTVSTLCSLSLEPPSMIACLHRDSRALPALLANEVFSANILAEDQAVIAEVFAGRIAEHREERFAAGAWDALATGSPVLLGALAAFDCRLAKTVEFGSHVIVIGEVVDIAVRDTEPLVFADRAFRRLTAA